MILDFDQIKDIIINNPNAALVQKGVAYNKEMRMHIYGDKLSDNVHKIDGLEAEWIKTLRVKYIRSNKDLFSRLGRPIDKVFSARGGSVYYNLADTQDKKARALSLDVRNGFSIRKWVEVFWKPHMLDDPFGLIFLEILPLQQAVLAKQQGRSFVYPTYKSITAIYDYLPKGSSLDYVVFKVSDAEKKKEGFKDAEQVYRVVDDAFDYYVVRVDETITIPAEKRLVNFFGMVPGMINSDLMNPENDNCFLSLYDDCIELAKHFLLKGSIKLTHEFMHAFPKYWEYADDCPKCQGTRFVNGETCESCKGSGKSTMSKVSDVKLLSYPGKDDPKLTPDIAGYVSPDKAYFEIASTDLQLLEELMNLTLWGSHDKKKTQGMSIGNGAQKGNQPTTATEVMDDMKPQADRLKPVSEMAEKRHKFILDAAIRLQIAMGYGGSSVNYGRRYMIEGPDTIWQKYSDARTKGAAIGALDDLLLEYYEAKYESDPVKFAIQSKLMKVEPFVHFTTQQVDQSTSMTTESKTMKAYFSEWLSEQSEGLILSTDIKILRESLKTYSTAAAVQIQAQIDAQNQPKKVA